MMSNDIDNALKFVQERYSFITNRIGINNPFDSDASLSQYAEEYKNIHKLLLELSRLRSAEKNTILMVDLAELPKGTDLEQFLQTYREKGVLLIDTFNCGHQVANTRIIENPNNKKTE